MGLEDIVGEVGIDGEEGTPKESDHKDGGQWESRSDLQKNGHYQDGHNQDREEVHQGGGPESVEEDTEKDIPLLVEAIVIEGSVPLLVDQVGKLGVVKNHVGDEGEEERDNIRKFSQDP